MKNSRNEYCEQIEKDTKFRSAYYDGEHEIDKSNVELEFFFAKI